MFNLRTIILIKFLGLLYQYHPLKTHSETLKRKQKPLKTSQNIK